MTVFYLIRHAETEAVGKWIAGRMPGVNLNTKGHAQAHALAQRLRHLPIKRIYSGPLERTLQTAAPLAAALGLDVHVDTAINEVDYGQWTGASFDQLSHDDRWQRYNALRATTRIPDGEDAVGLQHRMVGWIEAVARDQTGHIAMVSHADPIKSIIMHYCGVQLDLVHRFEILPASVSVVRLSDGWPSVLSLNDVGTIPE